MIRPHFHTHSRANGKEIFIHSKHVAYFKLEIEMGIPMVLRALDYHRTFIEGFDDNL